MTVNLTAVEESKNLLQFHVAMDGASGGLISAFILASLFFLILIVFRKDDYDFKKVLLADSTIVSIVGMLMLAAGLIPWEIAIYPIILLFASIIIFKLT